MTQIQKSLLVWRRKSITIKHLKKLLFLVVLVTAFSSVARADTLVFSGTLNLGATQILFPSPIPPNGNATVIPGGTGIFASLGATGATISSLNFVVNPLNQPFLLPSFVTFSANPNLRLDLTFINLGVFPQAQCLAAPAPGQTCTPTVPLLVSPSNPAGLSEINFTNTSVTASTFSFSVHGTVVNGATSTPFDGIFSAQFATMPYQNILTTWNSGGVVPTTYSVTITTPAAVPEPATLLLVGTGLAGIAAKVKRRRKQLS